MNLRRSGGRTMRQGTILIAILLVGLLSASTSKAQQVLKGEWTAGFEGNRAWLSLKMARRGDSILDSSVNLDAENLKGLSLSKANSEAVSVHFEMTRDAGTFVFDGLMKNGHGVGDYQFTPNQDYVLALSAM